MKTAIRLRNSIRKINKSSEGIKLDKIRCLIPIESKRQRSKILNRLKGLSNYPADGSDNLLIRINKRDPDKISVGGLIYQNNYNLKYGEVGSRQIARIGMAPNSASINSHHMSIELNPSIITSNGQVVCQDENQILLGKALKEILGLNVYHSLIENTIISRLDHAIDLFNIHIYDLFISKKGVKVVSIIPKGSEYCFAETIIHGSYSIECLVKLYNKLIETNGKFDELDKEWTRCELVDKRGKKQLWTPANLQEKLAEYNPFADIIFYPSGLRRLMSMHSTKLSKKEIHAFASSVDKYGINRALNSLDDNEKYKFNKILADFPQYQISDDAWNKYVSSIERYFRFLRQ